MIQTLEEGMKNQSKCIKVPREIRPFDIGYRIVNQHGNPLALKNGASIFALPSLAEKAIKKEFSKDDPDFDIEKHFVEEVAIMHLVITSKNVLNWLTKKSKTVRVVGLMVISSKRRIYKMKRLGIVLGAVFVIVVSPFVVQYGWNEIITTIVPVGKITVWQALGMDALLSFIWPVLSSKKESEEDYSYAVRSSISKIITCAFLIWLASLFI